MPFEVGRRALNIAEHDDQSPAKALELLQSLRIGLSLAQQFRHSHAGIGTLAHSEQDGSRMWAGGAGSFVLFAILFFSLSLFFFYLLRCARLWITFRKCWNGVSEQTNEDMFYGSRQFSVFRSQQSHSLPPGKSMAIVAKQHLQ